MTAKNKPVRLKGAAYTKFRWEVYEHYGGVCAKCHRYAPIETNSVPAGEVSHIVHRGMGGKNGPGDVLENAEWLCIWCHEKKHKGNI